MKKVLIGSDKSGFELKEALKVHLTEQGYEVSDCGTTDVEEPKGYFIVAPIAAQKIADKEFEKAILICGTGMGMAIVANKYQGVYAAVCENTYAAEKSRAINDANVLTLGGWITGEIVGCEIADKFLQTEFTENLETWRQEFLRNAREKVKEIENNIYQ
jgi:sugar-phosphate isomerases, RpiB/LacA/LacB family